MDDVLVQFGKNVKALRLRSRWSQDRLAQELGINRNSVSRIELGLQNPSLLLLVQLARVFGVPLATLLFHCDPTPIQLEPAN